MIALDSKGEPFIAWKPGYMHSIVGNTLGGTSLGPLIPIDPTTLHRPIPQPAPDPAPSPTRKMTDRGALASASISAAREYKVTVEAVRQPSPLPTVKRARGKAAHILLTWPDELGTGRRFTVSEVAVMLQFTDADSMVALVKSMGLRTR